MVSDWLDGMSLLDIMILHICDLPSCVYSLSLPSNISGCWKNIAKPPEKTFPASQMSQEALQPTMASCPNSTPQLSITNMERWSRCGAMEFRAGIWRRGGVSVTSEILFPRELKCSLLVLQKCAEIGIISWLSFLPVHLCSSHFCLLAPLSVSHCDAGTLMLSKTFPLLPTQCQISLFSLSSIGWENVYCLYRNAQNLTFAQVSHLSLKMYSNHAHLQLGHYIYLWCLAVE